MGISMLRRNISVNKMVPIILAGILVAGCVRPVEPTPTPDPSADRPTALPTNATAANPTEPATESASPPATPVLGLAIEPNQIATWLQQYSDGVNNLTIFQQKQSGPDDIIAFTFQNTNGEHCAGFVQATVVSQQIWMGDYRCAAQGVPIVLGSALFALTTGTTTVAAYGYIDPDTMPEANAIAVEFQDGSSENQILSNNGFVVLKSGLVFPSRGTIIDAGGNQITSVIFQ